MWACHGHKQVRAFALACWFDGAVSEEDAEFTIRGIYPIPAEWPPDDVYLLQVRFLELSAPAYLEIGETIDTSNSERTDQMPVHAVTARRPQSGAGSDHRR